MIRGTTPTFQLKLISDSVDLTLAENVYEPSVAGWDEV